MFLLARKDQNTPFRRIRISKLGQVYLEENFDLNKSEINDKVVEDVRNRIMKTIVSYCVNSEEKVDLTKLIVALADVLSGQIAILTEDWTEDQTAEVVDRFFAYIANMVKKCRELPNPREECNDLIKEYLENMDEDKDNLN